MLEIDQSFEIIFHFFPLSLPASFLYICTFLSLISYRLSNVYVVLTKRYFGFPDISPWGEVQLITAVAILCTSTAERNLMSLNGINGNIIIFISW